VGQAGVLAAILSSSSRTAYYRDSNGFSNGWIDLVVLGVAVFFMATSRYL
jgi:hypothetical protein